METGWGKTNTYSHAYLLYATSVGSAQISIFSAVSVREAFKQARGRSSATPRLAGRTLPLLIAPTAPAATVAAT